MASDRHLGRIIALQTLYELDFRRDAGDLASRPTKSWSRNIQRYKDMVDDKEFIKLLVKGVSQSAENLIRFYGR